MQSSKASRYQQDLPNAALFRLCLGLRRFTQRHSLADRNCQLSISHRLGHELKSLSVEMGEYVRHFYGWVICRALRRLDNRGIHSSRLDLGDELLGGSSADRIRNG